MITVLVTLILFFGIGMLFAKGIIDFIYWIFDWDTSPNPRFNKRSRKDVQREIHR